MVAENISGQRLGKASFRFWIPVLALLTVLMLTLPISAENAFAAITLNWTAPTTNTDGTPLTDLSGYKLYYGTSAGNYTNSITLGNVITYTLNNLANGTYYFVATAYTAAGSESAPSNEVSKTESATSDTTPPTVNTFTIPATATSLTVSITSFTATDNVAVTGYLVNASATTPAASAAGWAATAPTSYTFTSAGTKTLYAWAKDAAGNVSTSRTASTTITLADTTPPTVNTFTIPATATSLTVSITSLTATDNVAVTGYLVNVSATTPAASAAGWAATAPTSYTFTSAGTKTLYAWAKDAAGNVSTSRNASTTITLSDTTPPTVTGFTMPATAASLEIPITLFTATDNIAVTGYIITEIATAPAASATGWSATAPTSHTTSAAGSKTFYAWAKDAAGNVSTSMSATVSINAKQSYRGVFRKGIWYMDMNQDGIWDASADTASPFGTAGDIPVMGDWDGTGTKKIGVFRNGIWYLDINGNNAWDPGVDVAIPFGTAGDIPVVGDWNGDGKTKIGVFRNGYWYLDMNGDNAWDPGVDAAIPFGTAGDIPVVGDWNGDGKIKIGVFRNGTWYVDTNGNNAWDPGIDSVMTWGMAGDKPIVK